VVKYLYIYFPEELRVRPRLLKTVLACGLTLGLGWGLTGPAAPAGASTGGTRDESLHPNVALIASYGAEGRFRCSATLVAPTVLLTAAHCTAAALGKVLVTFEPDVADQAPVPFPAAADPSVGYTATDLQRAGYLSGTPHTHPRFSGFTDMDDWNDVGVIVLPEPVTGIPAAPLADRSYLDAFAQPTLNQTLFTGVGYGNEVRKPDEGPQKPQPMDYPLVRRYVEMPGQKLTEQILQTNGNEHDTRGTGGTCFGDSGGPVFLDGRVVAVTSFSYTDNCRYLGGYQRVDIAVVQDWLAGFGI
jgi:Trypsin